MRAFLIIPFICLGITVLAGPPKATFTENKGQWPEQVLYRARIPGGMLFVERSALTYVLYSGGPLQHHGHAHQEGAPKDPGKAHAYRVTFVGSQGGVDVSGAYYKPLKQYENFFLGSDRTRWGTGCKVFDQLWIRDIWPGIHLHLDGMRGLKYEFLVEPGADASTVRMRYEGDVELSLQDGRLSIGSTVGEIFEEPPVSSIRTCMSAVAEIPVESSFKVQGDMVSFDLGGNYIPGVNQLLIDPVLSFASYSGSSGDNFGYTATYDDEGHLYGGGIVFDPGYPTTLGVIQDFFANGIIDIGISKWSPDGSTLIWSTYLGGNGNEGPNSLVVNSAHELFVMGSTGSANFPVTAGAFDESFNGGPALAGWTNISGGYGFDQSNGTDIYVAHFSADATALIGSTYVGGNNIDGLNSSTLLTHNYGDHFRGEIALDASGNPVVATTTRSSDMPVSPGAPQPVYGGGAQDGYCFRLNPGLTTLLWGTYVGGSLDDNGLGVQFASNGEVFVTGGTTSADLPMAGAPFQAAFLGTADGYLMRYSAAGNSLLSSTYIGTISYDQSYFVQLNTADEVFVVGQTRGDYPMTPGKYGVPNSSQFIHKFTNDLSTSLWSTRLGNGAISQDISPTAFLVSDCDQIYLSGWAGTTNSNAGNFNSTTAGSPVTPDAFQSGTTGSDVYLMVLDAEASGLNYATFFGGATSAEHVDGGTSRFDKNGTVYHAVCAGCGGSDDFPTTPGAWSNTNNSFNCNLGVFKFDLGQAQAVIGIDGPASVCFPATAQFTNNSIGGTDYFWDFGDGDTSTAEEPSHVYDEEGVFTVTMILTDSSACINADTATIVVTSLPPPEAVAETVDPICPGASTQLHASGGDAYQWIPSIGLDDPDIADPIATPDVTTTYIVIVSGECGNDTAQVEVELIDPQAFAFPDTSACLGSSVQIGATGGGTYEWSPPGTLSDPSIATPIATPPDTTTYTVVITSPEGCVVTDSLVVNVFSGPPEPGLLDTIICAGTSLQLHAPDALHYEWQPADGISMLDVQDPIVTPAVPTTYTVELINACGSVLDDVFVDLIFVNALVWPDTIVCPGQPVELHASGGLSYSWAPAHGSSDPDSSVTTVVPSGATTYTVTVIDADGCQDTATTYIELFPPATVYAGRDVVIDWHDQVQLNATGTGAFTWSPPTWLDCTECPSPIAMPDESIAYTVTVTDTNGCTATDQVIIIINGTLYIPNTFTPDGDGFNDGFGAWGKDIKEIELLVFNRWGELIWSTAQLNDRWDGTYNGVQSPIDTYVWRVKAVELSGRLREAVGHVNLVR